MTSPDQRLLLVRENGAWALPHIECEQGWLADAVADLRASFRQRYGGDIAVLRLLSWLQDTITCEIELLAPATDGAWHDADQATALLPPHQGTVISQWLDGNGHERNIAPWQRHGRLAEARSWIEKRVRPLDDLLQVKAGWNGSCVLRAESAGRVSYFKASPARRPGEPAVIRALAARWPRHLPEVIDADEERCWLLMRDIEGRPIDSRNPADLAEVAQVMARIQIAETERMEWWDAMGCLDRGISVMRTRLERLLADIPSQLCDAGVIAASERDRIAALIPRADAMCAELMDMPIPHRSIHHEDFRDGNVHRTRSGNVVLIDWNDTVISHPFFTAQRFLWFIPPPPGVMRHEIGGPGDDSRRRLRDAYLEPFAAFARRRVLRKAFDFSSRLAPVYDVLRFDGGGQTEEALRQGLTEQQTGIARFLMHQLVDVSPPPSLLSRLTRFVSKSSR